MAKPRAVVLLSGGLDSTTAAAIAHEDGFEVHALSIHYGQRAASELDAARAVGVALAVASHKIVQVDLRALGGSALTDDAIDVPQDRSDEAIADGIPPTYVPARNTVFLSLALAAAEVIDADAIYIGVNALDYSGYPDCRPEFLDAMAGVAATGTKRGAEGRAIRIAAPLIALSKAEIVRRGIALHAPLSQTLSCYDPVRQAAGWQHCGRCDACRLRAKGFSEAGIDDPAPGPWTARPSGSE